MSALFLCLHVCDVIKFRDRPLIWVDISLRLIARDVRVRLRAISELVSYSAVKKTIVSHLKQR